jgi:hypothetical protein
MPFFSPTSWRTVPPAASSTLPQSSAFERELAADELLLHHGPERLEAVLGAGPQGHAVLAQLDLGAGPLEVEPGGDLPGDLVDGVAHFLRVEL